MQLTNFFGLIERRGARDVLEVEIFEVVFFIVLIKVIFLDFISHDNFDAKKAESFFNKLHFL